MAAVRRSTRLSSAGKATLTATPRRSNTWRRSHNYVEEAAEDSDDNSDIDFVKSKEVSELVTLENNENCNVMNKIECTSKHKSDKQKSHNKKTNHHSEEELLKTPRSSKKIKPMPASKKKELLSKRKAQNCQSDAEESQSDNDVEDSSVQPLQVSPPKQARQQQLKHKQHLQKHLISPTRLLDRLSLDERKEDSEKEDSEDFHNNETNPKETHSCSPRARNKYQNARRVLNSAETQQLPGREAQLQELRDFFSEHLHKQTSGSLYVSGQPGTGKTACLSLLLRAPEFAHRLQRVYINCTSIASVGGVYKKICAELKLQPNGRTERDNLAAIQKHLRNNARMVLIVLDEIDQLCSSRQSVLYTIFEWPALPGAKLLLVGIANSLDLTERALMRLNARCELKPRLMHFAPYTKQQIVDIFKARLDEAGVLEVFPPVTLQLLAAKVSAVSGDVRRALDIGRRVVEIAEQQRNAGTKVVVNLKDLELEDQQEEILKPVQVAQVAAVLNKVYGVSQNLQEDIEESFPLQQKIMICSLMLMLRSERNKDISMGRLHEVYRRVCSKRNILALDHAEFAGLVDLVETRGILRIVRKKEPRLSKVQLQWDEEEVNAALSDKQLIASILVDTACLSR